ncbi:MAG: DUF72 domain-containing protein [Candidatus Omnitrophica bacterium]|nr:DUF72 domain-containing protein [Candidatus Omnitrophota bacterium]
MFYIGTSGWNYPHWKVRFYPEGLSQNKWLDYYVKFFNAVELNVTFYRLVKRQTFKNWYENTPKGFYFVVKGSRFITHVKKLKDCKKPLKIFFDNCSVLKEKLSCILWQLPAGFKKDTSRLIEFLNLLNHYIKGIKQAIEFRNKSWFTEDIYALLRQYNVSLCIAHSDRWPCEKVITADFLYLRFHGGEALYSSDYSEKELKEWAGFALGSKLKDIFAFFNNDNEAFAVKNALRFKQLLKG